MKSERYPDRYHPEKTICKFRWSYPVIHISRGEIRTCDKPINIKLTEDDFKRLGTDAFINNEYLIERRLEKLQGFRHSDCFTCIKLEDRGIQSTRTGKDPYMKWVNEVVGMNQTFEELTATIPAEALRADHPEYLEISLSNLCNLKCVYCSSVFSTSWEDEDIKSGKMSVNDKESKRFMAPPSMENYFWEWFDKIKGSLKRIIFIGGEPLFNNKLYDYLDRMYEMHEPKDENDKIWINIISNFSIPESFFDKLITRIPKLTQKFNLHIEASGEAYGDKLEYIREGLNWKTYTRNLEKLLSLRQPGVYFGVQLAVNAICISSLKQYLEYIFNLQEKYDCAIDFKQNIVVAPEILSPYILTPEFVPVIQEVITFVEEYFANPEKNKASFGYTTSAERWKELVPFLKSIRYGIEHTKNVDHLRKGFAEFVARNDQLRRRNFEKTFPEYLNFLQVCRNA